MYYCASHGLGKGRGHKSHKKRKMFAFKKKEQLKVSDVDGLRRLGQIFMPNFTCDGRRASDKKQIRPDERIISKNSP